MSKGLGIVNQRMKSNTLIEQNANLISELNIRRSLAYQRIQVSGALYQLAEKVHDSKSSLEAKSFFYNHLKVFQRHLGFLDKMELEFNELEAMSEYYQHMCHQLQDRNKQLEQELNKFQL